MKQFLKDWTLVIAIMSGILGYFIYVSIPWLDGTHEFALAALGYTQPLLIFSMLFLTFCRVDPRQIRPCKWMWWLLLIQGGLFTCIGAVTAFIPQGGLRVVLEGASLCLICPTATAAAVVTRKLGGDVAHIVSYTIMINLLCSILVPALVPWVHPHHQLDFMTSFLIVLAKVFPLLLLPLIGAWLIEKLLPRIHAFLVTFAELPFYLWAVALTLALVSTTRSVVHSEVSLSTQLWLVAVSLACCVFQFAVGKAIGRRYGDAVSAGQAIGQKNTVMVIWMGFTFFTPVTAVVGGFYSIWHNLYNTWQLRRTADKR